MLLKKREVHMLDGRLYPNLLLYALPLMLSGILQLLYNAADVIVVGRWSGRLALAAVGSCGALANLMTTLFLGLSVGTSVVVAQRIGARRLQEVSSAVQTSITVSAVCGIFLAVFGFFFARRALMLMDTPGDVIELSTLYLKIIFLGVPGGMIYNFGAAVLRAAGDTKHPLYFLAVSGAVNVVLNLIFVICFRMGVAGVALATILSQYLSAVMVLVTLARSRECYHFDWRRPGINAADLKLLLRVGLPAGFQSTLFSLSNVLIQSTINGFGSTVMAANSASSNLEGFLYISMNALHYTALSFIGQNFGARQYSRIKKVLPACLLIVSVIGLTIGCGFYLFRVPLLSVYAPGQPEVVEAACVRASIIFLTHFTSGLMDVSTGAMRGLGYSLTPTVVTLLGACGLRIVWLAAVFPLNPIPENVYISYPISWVITSLILIGCFWAAAHKLPADGEPCQLKQSAV